MIRLVRLAVSAASLTFAIALCATLLQAQTAQLAGLPVTTTFNGYFAAVVAGGTQLCVPAAVFNDTMRPAFPEK